MLIEGGCALVLNVKDIDGAKSRILIKSPLHIIRRATKREVEKFDKTLGKMFIPYNESAENIFRANYSLAKNGKTGQINYTVTELDETNWKYFIIEYKNGQNQPIINLEKAMRIIDKEILIGHKSVIPSEIHFLHGRTPYLRDDFFISLTKENAAIIRNTYDRLVDHNDGIFNINNRINQLCQLDRIPLISPLRTLGYFTIIESMISHQPERGDYYNSITNQISRNFNLINNRLEKCIDFTKYFHFTNYQNLWPKLYRLRSCIAHGGSIDYSGIFQPLKNDENVMQFLHETIKKFLFHSLYEPELMRDLIWSPNI